MRPAGVVRGGQVSLERRDAAEGDDPRQQLGDPPRERVDAVGDRAEAASEHELDGRGEAALAGDAARGDDCAVRDGEQGVAFRLGDLVAIAAEVAVVLRASHLVRVPGGRSRH